MHFYNTRNSSLFYIDFIVELLFENSQFGPTFLNSLTREIENSENISLFGKTLRNSLSLSLIDSLLTYTFFLFSLFFNTKFSFTALPQWSPGHYENHWDFSAFKVWRHALAQKRDFVVQLVCDFSGAQGSSTLRINHYSLLVLLYILNLQKDRSDGISVFLECSFITM